jgi:hypothetical protein
MVVVHVRYLWLFFNLNEPVAMARMAKNAGLHCLIDQKLGNTPAKDHKDQQLAYRYKWVSHFASRNAVIKPAALCQSPRPAG